MFKTTTCLALAAVTLTACSVVPEASPQYSQHRAPVYAQPMNASYSTTQTAAADPNCQRRETNRELIGGAVGGAVGAYAGKELIGGTKGMVAGAALGGVAGYGVGDISIDCSPAYTPAAHSNAVYQSAPAYSATPASFGGPVTCPIGTTPHASSGSCLLNDPNASLQSATFTGAVSPTPSYQQVQSPMQSQNVISAATTPMAPSPYMGTEVTRSYGAANYRVQSGDTVYSLARKLCVPITSIQSSNGLDANYGIQIGQGLQLPASRC